jgi:hypothetical protein
VSCVFHSCSLVYFGHRALTQGTAQPEQCVLVVRVRDLFPMQTTPEAAARGREQRQRAAEAQGTNDAVAQQAGGFCLRGGNYHLRGGGFYGRRRVVNVLVFFDGEDHELLLCAGLLCTPTNSGTCRPLSWP